jgi:putative membrane protein
MKKICLLLLTSVTLLGFYACNNDNASNKEAKEENKEKFDSTNVKKDADFAVKAASGGMMEVELGKIAVANAASEDVKKFGQQMIDDHSKVNDELKSTAASKNISLPAEPNSDAMSKINDMRQKKGKDFDKDYVDMMVKDHNDDIDEFKKEADNGNDPDLKAWAGNKLPTLQHHLEMAKSIQDNLKK